MKLTLADTPLRGSMCEAFRTAQPFPLLTIDDFLPAPVAHQLIGAITQHGDFQKSNDYIFAKNKFENPKIEELGGAGQSLRELLLSQEFASVLTTIYGRTLFVDPDFVGGGLHRGGEGSYLDMHADFNVHPRQRTWIRELNILLYLNKSWQPEYGGCLDLQNAHTGKEKSIEPLFNRMVIMLTKDFTYHGYKPIKFPTGMFRTSVAAYAYSLATSEEELTNLRSTTKWVPADGNPLKAAVARVTPQLVTLKQRLFGSATARKK